MRSDDCICGQSHRPVIVIAYRVRRGIEDATLRLVDLIASYLDKAGTSVRVLSMDMSAAFQTKQHHVLIQILLDLDVNSDLVDKAVSMRSATAGQSEFPHVGQTCIV